MADDHRAGKIRPAGGEDMIVIAVDPGLVTGIAWWIPDLSPTPGCGEFSKKNVGSVLEGLLQGKDPESVIVVCEKYVLLPGVKSAQPEALMFMGVVEFLCQKYGVKLVWQFPRDAKKMCTDGFLRKTGWYMKTKDGHANDAMRHVGLWLALNQPEEFAKLIGI